MTQADDGARRRSVLARLLRRTQGPLPWRTAIGAGIGGAVAIAVLALVGETTSLAVLAAAFGSSCVLLFTVPGAPFSQPINLIGGHLVSAAWGVVVAALLPATWWSIALAVGLAIFTMAALRITHPPAGGNPIAIITAGASWGYLLVPILLGCVILVVVALVLHRLTGTKYPAP